MVRWWWTCPGPCAGSGSRGRTIRIGWRPISRSRERDCLGFLVEGLSTSAIAAKLHISPATVRTHIQAVLTKLGVHSRLEAASLAVRYQLLGPD